MGRMSRKRSMSKTTPKSDSGAVQKEETPLAKLRKTEDQLTESLTDTSTKIEDINCAALTENFNKRDSPVKAAPKFRKGRGRKKAVTVTPVNPSPEEQYCNRGDVVHKDVEDCSQPKGDNTGHVTSGGDNSLRPQEERGEDLRNENNETDRETTEVEEQAEIENKESENMPDNKTETEDTTLSRNADCDTTDADKTEDGTKEHSLAEICDSHHDGQSPEADPLVKNSVAKTDGTLGRVIEENKILERCSDEKEDSQSKIVASNTSVNSINIQSIDKPSIINPQLDCKENNSDILVEYFKDDVQTKKDQPMESDVLLKSNTKEPISAVLTDASKSEDDFDKVQYSNELSSNDKAKKSGYDRFEGTLNSQLQDGIKYEAHSSKPENATEEKEISCHSTAQDTVKIPTDSSNHSEQETDMTNEKKSPDSKTLIESVKQSENESKAESKTIHESERHFENKSESKCNSDIKNESSPDSNIETESTSNRTTKSESETTEEAYEQMEDISEADKTQPFIPSLENEDSDSILKVPCCDITNKTEMAIVTCDEEIMDESDITDSQLCNLNWDADPTPDTPTLSNRNQERVVAPRSPNPCTILADGTKVVQGLIKELTSLNQSLVRTTKEMESVRKRRQNCGQRPYQM